MNFLEAYAISQQGKKIRRKEWDKEVYLYQDRRYGLRYNDNGEVFMPVHLKPILAKDWEVVENENDQ